MKTRCLLLFLLFVLPGPLYSAGREDNHFEQHHYEAVPVGKENDKEEIEVRVSFAPDGVSLASRSVSEKAEERIQIRMTGQGDLISGTRKFITQGSVIDEKLWRDGNKVHIEQTSRKGRKTKVLDIPDGSILAVEASMFVLLRFFPYGSTAHWDLFMVDFSGHSGTATATQTALESISVHGENFPCYRLEVLFHVPIVEPRAICWVTVEEPHLVVRTIGKRGVFTPTYITSLIGRKVSANR